MRTRTVLGDSLPPDLTFHLETWQRLIAMRDLFGRATRLVRAKICGNGISTRSHQAVCGLRSHLSTLRPGFTVRGPQDEPISASHSRQLEQPILEHRRSRQSRPYFLALTYRITAESLRVLWYGQIQINEYITEHYLLKHTYTYANVKVFSVSIGSKCLWRMKLDCPRTL